MKRLTALLALALLSGLTLAQPFVLATTSQLTDLVRNVVAGRARVEGMMGPGVDPHLYRATPRDVLNLQQADLILFHGLGLEGQLGEVLERFAAINPTVAVAEALPRELLLPADSGGLASDPHIWMDAGLFRRTVPVIARQLADLDPANEAHYRQAADSFASQLHALHDWIIESIGTIPEGSRRLVTAHDAFAYYGRAYGLQVAAVQGLSTESEAGIADIRATVALIVDAGVPAIFVESTINPRTIQSVLEAVQAAGADTRLGGELYSDAMGPEGEPGGTYIGMMVHNTRVITRELGGQPPALPPGLADWAARWDAP